MRRFLMVLALCAAPVLASAGDDPATETMGDYAARSERTRIGYARMTADLLRENHPGLTSETVFACLEDMRGRSDLRRMLLRAAVLGCVNWPH